MTERVLPRGTRLIPPEAKLVFRGEIYEVINGRKRCPMAA